MSDRIKSMFLDGFEKTADGEGKLDLHTAVPAALAGVGTYTALRHRGSLGKNFPTAFKKMRGAAESHGFTRIHLHHKKPGPLAKKLTEFLKPADKHVHLTANRSYYTGYKAKGPVFDPEGTGHTTSKHMVGKTDKITDAINESKLHEYKTLKRLGVNIPRTKPLGSARTLKANEIAKPATGSQSRLAITHEDIKAHDPSHPLLKHFKKTKRGLDRFVRSQKENVDLENISKKINRHPGYRRWLTEQAIKKPSDFVRQNKIDIDKEFRVHLLHGKSLGVTSGRHSLSPFGRAEADKAAEKLVSKAHHSIKSNLLAADVAKDKKGKWHLIETNPGPESGFLTPSGAMSMIGGPHKFYKAITGKHSKAVAGLSGAAAAGATGYAAHKLVKKDEK